MPMIEPMVPIATPMTSTTIPIESASAWLR